MCRLEDGYLWAKTLQDDKRKLQSEIARLAAEVVQLKHRLAERADAHDRDGKALMRLGAENDELRAERDGLRERVERAERERDAALAWIGRRHSLSMAPRYPHYEHPDNVATSKLVALGRVVAGLDATLAGERGDHGDA